MSNPLSHKFENDSETDKLRGYLDSKSVPSGRKIGPQCKRVSNVRLR